MIKTFGNKNKLLQVKETLADITDLNDDKSLKHVVSIIARAQECPIINGAFGTYVNPFCHIRSDLN